MSMTTPERIRILAVDDEQAILNSYTQVLAPDKQSNHSQLQQLEQKLFGTQSTSIDSPTFDLVTCHQAEEAVQAVKQAIENNDPFAIAFLDVRMPPGSNGVWAAEQIRQLDPDIEIVIVTAYSDIDPVEIACRVQPVDKLLYTHKPFHPQEIRHFTRALGAKWHAERELLSINTKLEERVKERTNELAEKNISLKQNIKQLKAAEEALQESEEYSTNILNSIDAGIVVIDAQTHLITDVNKCASTMIGLSREQIIGHRCDQFICSQRVDQCPAIRFDVAIEAAEHMLISANGTHIPILKSIMPIERKNKPYLLESFVDITQLKQAEEKLRESEERYRLLFEVGDSGVLITDIYANNFLHANPAICEMLGYNQNELRHLSPTDIHPVESFIAAMEEASHSTLTTGTASGVPCRCKDGSIIYVDINVASATIAGQECIVGFYRDITMNKKLEDERIRFAKLESVGILAGGIAHDFNNFLTAILGNISLAKINVEPDSPLFSKLSDAETASQRAKNLTQQLLTFSQGGVPIRKASDISDLIRDAAQFTLSGSKVAFKCYIAHDLWAVDADEGQINQVINNIVINAIHATTINGQIKITARNINLKKPIANAPQLRGKFIKIAISDNGRGIPEKNLPSIFDPYYSTKQGGSGLGLTSCYSIIKNHDGYITVESELGIGTTFHIYLPASSNQVVENTDQQKQQTYAGSGKVLVMDDEDIIRNVASDMLKHIGYSVECAEEGEEAIELYTKAKESNNPFDMVIMDLTIPGGLGGKETIARLTKLDPEITAIASSGYSNDPIMANHQAFGFKGVLTKPYKIEDLSEVMHNILH